jgi:hypothetical protein
MQARDSEEPEPQIWFLNHAKAKIEQVLALYRLAAFAFLYDQAL